jgi:hypothetical protein
MGASPLALLLACTARTTIGAMLSFVRRRRQTRLETRLAAEWMYALHGARA